MRKHRNEMIRFADSKSGTLVWCRHKNKTKWKLVDVPTWDEDCIYIVDDEYASLRKESIDTGTPIQVKDKITGEWVTPSHELNFRLPLENYRLEPEKFKYPIYKRARNNGCVVKFTDLQEGVVVKDTEESRSVDHFVGYKPTEWVEHTDTYIWEDVSEEEIEEIEKHNKSHDENHDEKQEFNYPIYKKSKSGGSIVRFTDLTVGIVVWDQDISWVGNESENWINHTDPDVWQDISEKEINRLEKIIQFTDSTKCVEDTDTDVKEEIENHKLNFKYPLYKRSKILGSIVKFTDLRVGVVVWDRDISRIGHELEEWIPHTDTDVWADVGEEEVIRLEKAERNSIIISLKESGTIIIL